MKPALLVIDIQNAWLDENKELKKSVENRIDTINQSIRWFRTKELPIIVIQHEDKKYGAIPGSKPFECIDALDIRDDDLRITKRYPNSFTKTRLNDILRKNGCEVVVIVGLSASGCALATAFGALDHDLDSYFVKNGVASQSEEHVRFAEDICGTVKVGSFDQALLRKRRRA